MTELMKLRSEKINTKMQGSSSMASKRNTDFPLCNLVLSKRSENGASRMTKVGYNSNTGNRHKEQYFTSNKAHTFNETSTRVPTRDRMLESANAGNWHHDYENISLNSHHYINGKKKQQDSAYLGSVPFNSSIENRPISNNPYNAVNGNTKIKMLIADYELYPKHFKVQGPAYDTISAMANMALEPAYSRDLDQLQLTNYLHNNSPMDHTQKPRQNFKQFSNKPFPPHYISSPEDLSQLSTSSSVSSINIDQKEFLKTNKNKSCAKNEIGFNITMKSEKHLATLDLQWKHQKQQNRNVKRQQLHTYTGQYQQDKQEDQNSFEPQIHPIRYNCNSTMSKQRRNLSNQQRSFQQRKEENQYNENLISGEETPISQDSYQVDELFLDPIEKFDDNLPYFKAQVDHMCSDNIVLGPPHATNNLVKASGTSSSVTQSFQSSSRSIRQVQENDPSCAPKAIERSQSLRVFNKTSGAMPDDNNMAKTSFKTLKVNRSSSLKRPHTSLFRSNSINEFLPSSPTKKLSQPVLAEATKPTPSFNPMKLARAKLTRKKIAPTSPPDTSDLRNVSFTISDTGRAAVGPENIPVFLKRTKSALSASKDKTTVLTPQALKETDQHLVKPIQTEVRMLTHSSASASSKISSGYNTKSRYSTTSNSTHLVPSSGLCPTFNSDSISTESLVRAVSLTSKNRNTNKRSDSVPNRPHISSNATSSLTNLTSKSELNNKQYVTNRGPENQNSTSFTTSNVHNPLSIVDQIETEGTTDASVAVAKILARNRNNNGQDHSQSQEQNNHNNSAINQKSHSYNNNNDNNNKNNGFSVDGNTENNNMIQNKEPTMYTHRTNNDQTPQQIIRDALHPTTTFQLFNNSQIQAYNYNPVNVSSNLSPDLLQPSSLSLQDPNSASIYPGSLTPSIPPSIFYNQSPSMADIENMGFLNTTGVIEMGMGMVMPMPLDSDSMFLSDMSMNLNIVDMSDDLMAIVNAPFGSNEYHIDAVDGSMGVTYNN